jgi:hypothetical protein
MRFDRMIKVLGGSLRVARHGLGLALVMAAIASPLYALGPPPPVPEIDPGSAGGAVALLAGGVLLLTDRFRRR